MLFSITPVLNSSLPSLSSCRKRKPARQSALPLLQDGRYRMSLDQY